MIVTGGKGTATRGVGLLSGIFAFAVGEGLQTDNPVRGVLRYADGKSERTLSVDEIARPGTALRSIEAKGANPSAIAIIRLLVFTGARRSEIAGLRWQEIDFERDVIRLSAARHSRGRAAAQRILVTPPARAILESW